MISMKTIPFKKGIPLVLVTVLMLYSQDTFAQSNFQGVLSTVWKNAVAIAGFVAVMGTLIGGLVVYNKKSADDPKEFKNALQRFLIAIGFLFFVFGSLAVIKYFTTEAASLY
jgi:hypothetical protein